MSIDEISQIETHPLAPFLPVNARLLMLGSFPPPKERWKMDFYYPNYQNDMWRIFGLIFFNNKDYFLNLEHKNFHEDKIRHFLTEKGIAIFDTAYQVKRLKGNASDKFLDIVTPTDLEYLLRQIPVCSTIVTTGDKATDTLMQSFEPSTTKPVIGTPSETIFLQRKFNLYRMPSSSRAYPLALEKKAYAYAALFEAIGLL